MLQPLRLILLTALTLTLILGASVQVAMGLDTPPTPASTPAPTATSTPATRSASQSAQDPNQAPTQAPTPAIDPAIAAAARAGAGRVSPNVAVITIEGPIDSTTAASFERRLGAAEKAAADAVVIQINTPGGEVGATLRICGLLKKTTVPRTIAWVNDQAFSAGAIISLACQEIITASNARFGDAAPIRFSPIFGLQNLGDAERAKALAPLIVEMVDSARRNAYDEKLVQAFIALGVELWLVENASTGQRLFIDRAEYLLLFGQEPSPGALPRIASMADAPRRPLQPSSQPTAQPATIPSPANPAAAPDPAPTLRPAIPLARRELREVNEALALKGAAATRPVLTARDQGQWKLIEYATDGRTILTMRETDMLDWRLSRASVDTDAELKAYFAATQIGRLQMTWYESLAQILDDPMVRGILIVVMLIGLFIELVHPGLIVPGVVAGVALAGILLPGLLIGLGAWWALVAIVAGIALLMLEAFVLPGFGLFGVVGLLLLFGGLVMTFLPSEDLPFMDPSARWRGLGIGLVSVVIGTATAGAAIYYLSKHLRMVPFFGKLVLDTADAPDIATVATAASPLGPAMPDATAAGLAIGATGTTLTALRPSGKVEINGSVIDVVVDGGFIAAGEPVRVIAIEPMRTIVERC
jgi:membrane-bound ClpP family serine protease